MSSSVALISPAKLNLFLHVTGRREDGYHTLQTVFQLLDWGDRMTFTANNSGTVTLDMPGSDVPLRDNLILRAAQLLQRGTLGAAITCDKQIPMGGGLGGGSSNAASTLLALNRLWQLDMSLDTLQALGASLGADVPVFVGGHSAWAEGIGEVLTAIHLPEAWYLILKPRCAVPTGEIFSDRELTRDSLPITMAAFFQGVHRNDCEPVVVARYPETGEALNWLRQFAEPRLTGTGSCVFAAFGTREQAQAAQREVPGKWVSFVAKGVNESPALRALA
ncbi:MAG: 4-(cytidine 5'-diphospho)-2-C-methyl-D-erythritol kinase [Haliea sp.]|jgi:4-diphosphocytidyl-2-C-methyl-D-erythritol kinase|uniref:4-(cytidine 5'-diphospho)-2-C-methyl-D-erythritol kinase n=1 Tax=Haliea sp. TaxID=1932666 RepID=UPI000C63DA41|nr:4-(cytidine 5'-diphospho)-2-C-methyl-D-erythritol kinase [Haliea sp.]MBM70381.1 4-(cytidine 5'-diphospho)-2-C-methyl-D-erythritol kinase [Haliea sp.]|tara:strand:- start:52 stop:882 length:831 start_codon:yes stop_codon:yes gene_type:complete